MKWKVASASVRGSSHQRNGLPNQDAALSLVSTRQTKGTLSIAAVSDGHGSPRHFRSQVGSSHAVNIAANLLEEFLLHHGSATGNKSPAPEDIQELQKKLVDGWLTTIQGDLDSNPFTEEELSKLVDSDGMDGRTAVENDPVIAYGATLLAVGATESTVLYLQLGDGDILTVNSVGETMRPLPEDARLIANQTTSLCLPNAWQDFRAAFATGNGMPALILLSTDGYVNSFRSEEDFLKVGGDYLKIVREHGLDSLSQDLPNILAEASEHGSGDDISLSILQGDLSTSTAEEGKKHQDIPLARSTKSAMIQELKEQHSTQQKLLGNLSKQVEQAQQDNQKLRRTIITFLSLAILAAVGLYLHYHPIPTKQGIVTPGKHPGIKGMKPGTPIPGEKPLVTPPIIPKDIADVWTIHLSNKTDIPLFKGAEIQTQQVKHDGGKALYAEVAEENSRLELINRSHDAWKVFADPKNKSAVTVKNGEQVVLESDLTIVFDGNVSGSLVEKPHSQLVPAGQD